MKTKILRNLSSFLLMFVLAFNLQSQSISGIVTDDNGVPLPGATVLIEGTKIGVSTDFDGKFNISNVESGSTLIFTHIGYKTLNQAVGEETNLIILMQSDLSQLDEVVVIGYGTQKLSDISGAVSTVSSGAIETSSPVRVEDALQGQASGINIISSGSPGSKPTVLIRGITSYAGNDPLVIIDGVTAVIDDLNALNPNDIKSINILKTGSKTGSALQFTGIPD